MVLTMMIMQACMGMIDDLFALQVCACDEDGVKHVNGHGQHVDVEKYKRVFCSCLQSTANTGWVLARRCVRSDISDTGSSSVENHGCL